MPITIMAVITAWRLTNALDLKSWDLIVSAAVVGGVLDTLLL